MSEQEIEEMIDEMIGAEIVALADMIEDQAEALENEEVSEFEVIDIPESVAQNVVQELVNRGVDLGFILKQFVDASYGNEVLRLMITSLVPPNRQQELAEAIIGLPDDYWYRGGFDQTLVAGIIAEPATFKLSLERNLAIIRDEDHPLHGYLNVDEYWLARVRHYIVKKDYFRAVDELKKAWRGFPIQKNRGVGNYRYVLPASQDTISRLINDLHEAMVMSGTIPSNDQQTMKIVREDLFYMMTRYGTSVPRDGRKPMNDTYSMEISRSDLVTQFIIGDEDLPRWDFWSKPRTLSRDGIMLLSILHWYMPERNHVRNKNRRAKHEKAMAEYAKRRETRAV